MVGMWQNKQRENENQILINRIKIAVAVFLFVFIVGIVGIMYFEQRTIVDSIYFAVITMATVGFGDVVPLTPNGKIFTVIYVIFAILAMYYITTLVFSLLVAGQLFSVFGRRKMETKISEMRNHIIVCGCGKVGEYIVDHLILAKREFVVIDIDKEINEKLFAQNIPVILGDATDDNTLDEAQIKHAHGIIASLSSDALNVYLTLAAKSINPDIRIVAQAERPEAEKKLIAAGAEKVILPSFASANLMVSSMLRPDVYEWVGSLFDITDLSLGITQTKIAENSPLAGKTIAENKLKKDFNLMVISLKRNDKSITTPHGYEIIHAGDTLILLGAYEDLHRLKEFATNN